MEPITGSHVRGTAVNVITDADDALIEVGDDFGFDGAGIMSFDSLDEAFDVSSEIVSSEPEQVKPVQKEVDAIKSDTRKDYEYTRGNLYSLIEKGTRGS
jgi:hypothetical protein